MLGLILGIVSVGACSPGTQVSLSPDDRAVVLSVSGCGVSSRTTGSGFVFDDGLVVTVAHLVARGESVEVAYPDGSVVAAEVIAIDTVLDMAALGVPLHDVDRPLLGTAEPGDGSRVVGGFRSSTVPAVVIRRAWLSIEEVLGTERSRRLGYELTAETGDGDSGAAVYDDEGRLLGMVFAVSAAGTSTWATASEEIDRFVAEVDVSSKPYACNPERSRMESQ